MVPLYIHIPPISSDIEGGGRDERDVTEEVLSQAQVMYNIIASTATKGFKSKVYGQRHMSFEIVAHEGLVHYYAVVPVSLVDVVRQAVAAAYPAARLEEVSERNIFNPAGKMSATIGGEFTLKKEFGYPIATYQETKRDVSRALLNALSGATREDGVGIQILLRPADSGWSKVAADIASGMKKDKGKKSGPQSIMTGVMEALWKPPESQEVKSEDKQLSSVEQTVVDAIEDKTRYPGYETLIRVVASSNTSARSQALMSNVVSAFALFDSPQNNGFKFAVAKDMNEFVTAYIFRFFPQEVRTNILNTIELATIFHLPSQNSIPTSQVQRQATRQVDGPTQVMDDGFLLGYNEFRGTKKPIRLGAKDRRRHAYIIGQTGTGKSKLLENLAYQDMMDGRGFAFIDPHGDSAEELLGMVPKERVEDVIYFSPGDMEMPIGLNLFEFDNQDQRDFIIQETIAMLYRLYDPGHTGIIGPRFESWFRNAALTVMSDPNGSSFLDVQQVFIDQAFADEKIKHVRTQTVLDFWHKEMAQTTESAKGEMLGWFASKFGAFLANDMMRNIIGQTKSGFDLRDIMDNKKILLVNLSKGRVGELNSQLLGMIFVMKFNAAAMGRADMPEDQRQDFSLYVDEFQNFATDSFATILSEARKYRLSLILANQFMTQLTDQIREAILGNIGTIISGRIGITDADILVKKFAPTFDAEDLTRLPNYQTIASVMIQDVPSASFSMSLIPPLGKSNPQLRDALKNLSATKYGKQRAVVEQEFFKRMSAGDEAKKAKMAALKKAQDERMAAFKAGGPNGALQGGPGVANAPGGAPAASGRMPAGSGMSTKPSFLDEWLAKRQQIINQAPQPSSNNQSAGQMTAPQNASSVPARPSAEPNPAFGPTTQLGGVPVQQQQQPHPHPQSVQPVAPVKVQKEELSIRGGAGEDDGVSIKLR
ncbi:TraM recognition domain-containing protein [Candidatus Saccharibacteria bacterium TM7i]|nr:TraM recognition domain-containing protein [Candidatus Saccharibacteria bacterium TM7i]